MKPVKNAIRCFCVLTVLVTAISLSHAQISSDGTMGPAQTLVPGGTTGQDYTIPSDLGTQKGSNLFHSFGQFNVDTGESATFTGPSDIQNIISRVTGGNASWIDGMLACDITGANLWLLNPFGILFGPNASLDTTGSFHASTADYLKLSDGGVFYTDAGRTSSLTTAPPSSFGFLGNTPAGISIAGSELTVTDDATLSLVGGDIKIIDGKLIAPSGQINLVSLVSLASPGEVILNENSLTVAGSPQLGNIQIAGTAELHQAANRFLQRDRQSDNAENQDDTTPKNMVDDSNDSISPFLDESFFIDFEWSLSRFQFLDRPFELREFLRSRFADQSGYSLIDVSGSASDRTASGSVNIHCGNFTMDRSYIYAASYSKRNNAGDIQIYAGNAASIVNGDIFSFSYAEGKGGNIIFQGNELFLKNGGRLGCAAKGLGNGGDIMIRATDMSVDGVFDGSDGVYQSVIVCQSDASGKAGSIDIETDGLSVTNGGFISASTFGRGDGGDITIRATDVSVDGAFDGSDGVSRSNIVCGSGYDASGKSGSVNIETDILSVTNGGVISANTFGRGDGGGYINSCY